jgi:dTDP-4-dehydrorhamnose reductase
MSIPSATRRPRIVVTGAQGQVGFELARRLPAHGDVTALTRAELDLARPDAIVAMMRAVQPDLVVNAAAYTAVDLAERERDTAFAINATAPEVLAHEVKRAGAVLIHYSTDFVFDGNATVPYAEDAPVAPLNVYGASKLAGEQAIAASGARALTLRTSWVYGRRGRNFLLTIQRLAAQRDELTIVADQTGTPNWAGTLADTTAVLVGRGTGYLAERAGLYHLSATGATTWFGFAKAILGDAARPRVVPMRTADYPTPARRPSYSVFDTRRLRDVFDIELPAWEACLANCLNGVD